jgi:hypothetical protein
MEGPSEILSLQHKGSTHLIEPTSKPYTYPIFKSLVTLAGPFVKIIGGKYR